jgi:5'-nucleotidase
MRYFLSIALPLFVTGCAMKEPTPIELRLLAFNDFHGNIQSEDPTPGRVQIVKDGKAEMVDAGGAAYLAALIAEQRAGHDNNMLISAGDLTGASPMLSALLRDEPTIQIMNRIGLDLNTVGNHEFDAGRQEILRKAEGGCKDSAPCAGAEFEGAAFDYLAANVIDTARGEPLFAPYVVKEFGGIDVAFIGIVTTETPHIVSKDGIAGLTFLDEVTTLNRYADQLSKQGVEAIVGVLHEGSSATPDTSVDGGACIGLEGALNDIVAKASPAIDLFISGHTHQSYACRLNGRLVTQAGNYGRMLSVIDLTLDPVSGDVADAAARNLPVTRDLPADAAIVADLSRAEAATAPIRSQVVTTLPAALSRQQDAAGESALGDVIADGQLAAARNLGAVIALTNPGGIRQDLPSDPGKGLAVTLGDLFAVQPFNNNLVAMDVTGAQLKLLLEQQWLGQPEDRKPRMLQISDGFTYCYDDRRAEGDRILADTMHLNGEVIEGASIYRIVVNNFLAGGGDRFEVLREGRHLVQGGGDLEALRNYVTTAGGNLTVATVGRICRQH